MMEASMFKVKYFTAPWSWYLSLPNANNTNEEMWMISNQTYRLKMSPVSNTPVTPINRKWNNGRKPNLSRWRITVAGMNKETAVPMMEVSRTNVAEKVSATKVIPNGASQFPACKTKVPSVQTV